MSKKEYPLVYAVKNKNLRSRLKSRSGGFFVVLSDYILEQNGIVYGCILNEDMQVIHTRADDKRTRNMMQGSKYVQSNLNDTFKKVLNDLKNDKKVLFSGTSCQVSGLLAFIPPKYKDKLLTIDIVCHGVPSPKVFEDYIKWSEKKYKSKCHQIDFRNKIDFGWDSHIETIKLASGRKVNSKIYTRLFYSHLTMRPSCYQCPYKSIYHKSNITIADYWGIEKAAHKFDDNKGVSLVLLNDKIGEEYFKECRSNMELRKTRIENSLQTPLLRPFNEPINRVKFWSDYRIMEFDEITKKYAKNGINNQVYNLLSFMKDYIKYIFLKIKKR